MKRVLQKVFALFFFLMVLFALLGYGGDLPDKISNTMMPVLSGDLINKFSWEQTATGHDSTVFTGHDKNVSLKVPFLGLLTSFSYCEFQFYQIML